jgi:hypothetical protein
LLIYSNNHVPFFIYFCFHLALFSCSTGTLPISIGDLTYLQTLSLYNNHLFQSLPPSLTNLSQLITLDCYSNKLTGTIPFRTDGVLFPLLQVLDLDSNHLTGSIPINITQICPALQVLDLGSNHLTGSIPHQVFSELQNLTTLLLDLNMYVIGKSNLQFHHHGSTSPLS